MNSRSHGFVFEEREDKVACMCADVWGRSRLWRVRWLPGLALGVLVAALCGPIAAPGAPVARAADPTIVIASPASVSGPVETQLLVAGSGWNPGGNVRLFYNAPANNQPCGDPNDAQNLAQQHPLSNGTITAQQPDGSWTLPVQWPSTGTGQFYICGFDIADPTLVVASPQPFQVLSPNPPSLDPLQPAFPNVGDQVKISGHGFLPGNQAIDLWLTTNPSQPSQGASLGTVTADGAGNFAQTVTLPTSQSGNLTIVAQSRPSTQGAPPPLVATMDVTIGATPSTATPGPTGTATSVPTATPVVATPGTGEGASSGSSAARVILVVLLVLLGLVIAAILGVLVWYFLGIRPPAGAGVSAGPGRPRAPVTPRPSQPGWHSRANWEGEDEWEEQQGPWEEDAQGAWGDAPTQWGGGPPGRSAPASGPQYEGVPRPPRPRPPSRDDWQGRAGPGQDGW